MINQLIPGKCLIFIIASVTDMRNNLPTGITDVNDQAQQHEQSCPAHVSNDSAEQYIA